jgi:hypothetical protein
MKDFASQERDRQCALKQRIERLGQESTEDNHIHVTDGSIQFNSRNEQPRDSLFFLIRDCALKTISERKNGKAGPSRPGRRPLDELQQVPRSTPFMCSTRDNRLLTSKHGRSLVSDTRGTIRECPSEHIQVNNACPQPPLRWMNAIHPQRTIMHSK